MPSVVTSPTTAQTFVVPRSRPTINSSFFPIGILSKAPLEPSLCGKMMHNVRSARLFYLPLGRFGDWKLSLQIGLARIIEVDSGHKRGPIQLVQGIYY